MLKPREKQGFTLIETLVGTAIFLIISLATYQAFVALMNGVAHSRVKVAATALAEEQFEIIRNMPYADIGIAGGIPVGKIIRNQAILRGTYSFTASTVIRNIDDPFDGTIGGTPNDTSPADYKLVDLSIGCTNCQNFSPIKFTALFAPRALETASNNGALFIRVFNASGVPVPNVNLHIVNTGTNPDTIIDDVTDNDGWLKIIDAPPGVNAYNITATKSGYTSDQTYPIGGVAGSTPINPDVTVVIKQVAQTSLSIDQTSSAVISTLNASCTPLANIPLKISGMKTIGAGILKYPENNFLTNSSGSYTISNLEWDTYSILSNSPILYDLAGINPSPSFILNPNENKNIQVIIVPHSTNALLVLVKDGTGNTIDGATVHLTKSGFDGNKLTGSENCSAPGQVFWNGLGGGTYNITVVKDGYQPYSGTIAVNSWSLKEILLTP